MFYFETVTINKREVKVLQYAVYLDKEKPIEYTDYQQAIDVERKELKISTKEWNSERNLLKLKLKKNKEL